MPDFPVGSLPLEEVRQRVGRALSCGKFFVADSLRLEWGHLTAEEITWEIFHGRLLDDTQTRERRSFEAWNGYVHDGEERSAEPLLAVKLDAQAWCLYVVRAIWSYAWEGYHAGDNVYLSRETKKWLRELVGMIDLAAVANGAQLEEMLGCRLSQAVYGMSRLPLTSVEAPLPAFSLGELAYFPQAPDAAEAMTSADDLLARALTTEQPLATRAKLLETLLRATPTAKIAAAADAFAARWEAIGQQTEQIGELFRALFDDVALSPYTEFVDRTLQFLESLETQGHWQAVQHVDFLSGLLRQLIRHLTAYDLVTFHHRGANYPDALLLDAALQAYFRLAERAPELFQPAKKDGEGAERTKRLRRRAIRQACLLRCWYEGHPVPDLPTSPGENSRVLPPPFTRVPEEQITDPTKRSRNLFADDPLLSCLTPFSRELLHGALADLEHPAELQELGMALFLDRPLGVFKRAGEPDPTPLLSYEAFSQSIAAKRLEFLSEHFGAFARPVDWQRWRERIHAGLPVPGIALQPAPIPARPGVASLADPFRIAPDFLLLRTTNRSASEFWARYDLTPLAQRFTADFLEPGCRLLIVRGAAIGRDAGTLHVFDALLRQRLELALDSQLGYVNQASGCQLLELCVRRVWEEREPSAPLVEHDLSREDMRLRARV